MMRPKLRLLVARRIGLDGRLVIDRPVFGPTFHFIEEFLLIRRALLIFDRLANVWLGLFERDRGGFLPLDDADDVITGIVLDDLIELAHFDCKPSALDLLRCEAADGRPVVLAAVLCMRLLRMLAGDSGEG